MPDKETLTHSNRRSRTRLAAWGVWSCVLLSGCGGSSTPTNESTDSLGQEPRVSLQIITPEQRRLTVTTVSEQTVTVGAEDRSRTITAAMNVDTLMTQSGDLFKVDVLRELESFSPDTLRPPEFEFDRITQRYNANGEKQSFASSETILDVLALDSYFLPDMVLSSPGIPLGVGATWTERNELDSLLSTTRARIDAISDDRVSVSKSITTGSDEQNRYDISANMSADYSRGSMLLQSADINITIRYEDELYINGIRQSIVDQSTWTQTIREVSE